ncbi:hypothetical protein VNO77_17279 [Canavalia gladiata]|uniref:Bifunctional inhibitor/plant lipid transfer protein/seed storage helical domain-containing protein n=1 Tax=Canavalia gladiata TaxID=3824 RepID=A0AAN9LMB3_CANGL
MERVEIFNLITIALTFLALVPEMESQIIPQFFTVPSKTPRPLCASQFALVNYACSRLPFIHGVPPAPSSSSDSPPSPEDEEGHKNHHKNESSHSHRHRHKHRHHETPDEENCCRWAKEVDNECVCELLVRLPPFLVRPLHRYTLNVGESCEITYSCGSPI